MHNFKVILFIDNENFFWKKKAALNSQEQKHPALLKDILIS